MGSRERRHPGGEQAAAPVLGFEAPGTPWLESLAVACSALLTLCVGAALLAGAIA